jgi:hypothetical protein
MNPGRLKLRQDAERLAEHAAVLEPVLTPYTTLSADAIQAAQERLGQAQAADHQLTFDLLR